VIRELRRCLRELALLFREMRKGMRVVRKGPGARQPTERTPIARAVSSDDASDATDDGDELPVPFQRILEETRKTAEEFGTVANLYATPAPDAQTSATPPAS
jgi:hypothetical protein